VIQEIKNREAFARIYAWLKTVHWADKDDPLIKEDAEVLYGRLKKWLEKK